MEEIEIKNVRLPLYPGVIKSLRATFRVSAPQRECVRHKCGEKVHLHEKLCSHHAHHGHDGRAVSHVNGPLLQKGSIYMRNCPHEAALLPNVDSSERCFTVSIC